MESDPSDSEPKPKVQKEISTVFGKCRCCLQNGYMKNLWEEHHYEENREVFGEMIIETFAIAWEEAEDSKPYICEWCIVRLRDATNFKQQVLACQQFMGADSDEYEDEKPNQDSICEEDEKPNQDSIWDEDEKPNQDSIWDEYEESSQLQYSETEEMETLKEETEYEDLEFLEEYEDVVESTSTIQESEPEKKKTRKRRSAASDEYTVYKNYTSADMKKAVTAILDKTMSIGEASNHFNIPRKTVAARVLAIKKNPEKLEFLNDEERERKMEIQYKFTAEVKTLLDYTTAVPFKIRSGKIFCAFCPDREHFEDPADLREHARVHDDYAEMIIERALRPHFQNEILRIDIANLHCKVCSTHLSAWNDMFEHLKEQHCIELDQAYTKLIPYKLRENKPYCALCQAEFPNFQFLDAHMNAHYCNYMCSQCGEPFLTEARLKHHMIIHNTGKFPCQQCGKIFHLEKYRKKHIAMVHRETKMFKCECGEAFHVDYERHQHIVKEHPEKVRVVTCEFCGKSFDWRPYYLSHLRKVHIKNKCNYCKYCKKGFITKHELKQHELRHEGKGKFVCLFCQKNYVTAAELRKHSQRHYINSEIEIISNEENSQDKTIIVRQLSNPEAQTVKSKKIAVQGKNSKNPVVVTESVKPKTQDVGKKVRKKIELEYETDSLNSKAENKIKYKVIYHQ